MKEIKNGANWLRSMGTLDADRASSRVTRIIMRVSNSVLSKSEKGGGVWL